MKLTKVVQELAEILVQRGWRLATAESCTGGGVMHALTEVAGSSRWLEGGLITYSNASKGLLLNIPTTLIDSYGAVSSEVAMAMAAGACARTGAEVAVSTTGIAGPGGETSETPLGTVWFGWCVAGSVSATRRQFPGNRAEVRAAAVEFALIGLLERLLDVGTNHVADEHFAGPSRGQD